MLALGENQPFMEWWERTTQPLPDQIASGDIICANNAVICPDGPFVGRTPLAISLLKSLQTALNSTIQNLELKLRLGLSRTDGVIDAPTVEIVRDILAQTVNDAVPAPEVVAEIDVAQQAPALLRYLKGARRPPTVALPTPMPPPSKGMSAPVKIVIGVGIVAAVVGLGVYLSKR